MHRPAFFIILAVILVDFDVPVFLMIVEGSKEIFKVNPTCLTFFFFLKVNFRLTEILLIFTFLFRNDNFFSLLLSCFIELLFIYFLLLSLCSCSIILFLRIFLLEIFLSQA